MIVKVTGLYLKSFWFNSFLGWGLIQTRWLSLRFSDRFLQWDVIVNSTTEQCFCTKFSCSCKSLSCPRGGIVQHVHCSVFVILPQTWNFRLISKCFVMFIIFSMNNSKRFLSSWGNLLWQERRLSRWIRSVASVYDYMFCSSIDVILKGYYPVAAYLWICIMGL